MRPAAVVPYPAERWPAKRDRETVAAMHPAARHAAVTSVLTALYPRRRSAGVLAMLIWLTAAALASGNGVHVGHDELAERFGIGRRTVTRRLVEWRALRNLDRKRRGRHGEGVTWFTVPASVVHAVATIARAQRPKRASISGRDIKRRNASQSQRANLPQVAALRAAGAGPAPVSGRPAVLPVAERIAAQKERIHRLLFGDD